jgi:type II secretory pathway pseudopilin PulG
MKIRCTHSMEKSESGFALLMALVVIAVVISIGLSVLDLSIKQVRLATNAKDSEISFHAANAGMECARYWRKAASSTMERGNAIAPTCFSVSPDTNTRSQISSGVTGNGNVYLYSYKFTWGTSPNQRCSDIVTLVASSTPLGAGLTINSMTNHVPGYPSSQKTCAAGERCTVVSVRGYNRPCSTATGYGTVQREVLLQY